MSPPSLQWQDHHAYVLEPRVIVIVVQYKAAILLIFEMSSGDLYLLI